MVSHVCITNGKTGEVLHATLEIHHICSSGHQSCFPSVPYVVYRAIILIITGTMHVKIAFAVGRLAPVSILYAGLTSEVSFFADLSVSASTAAAHGIVSQYSC